MALLLSQTCWPEIMFRPRRVYLLQFADRSGTAEAEEEGDRPAATVLIWFQVECLRNFDNVPNFTSSVLLSVKRRQHTTTHQQLLSRSHRRIVCHGNNVMNIIIIVLKGVRMPLFWGGVGEVLKVIISINGWKVKGGVVGVKSNPIRSDNGCCCSVYEVGSY